MLLATHHGSSENGRVGALTVLAGVLEGVGELRHGARMYPTVVA